RSAYACRPEKENSSSDMGSFLPWRSWSLIVLFLLLQSMLQLSSGCFVEERAALLDIQSSLIRAHSQISLDSWRKDDDDCCSWDLVKCNNSTQRVSHLDLSLVYFPADVDDRWYLNLTAFSAFHELRYLDLSYNYQCSLSSE
uniref:Leucine-rich repeat-containing N-terminal plant-type domain-containing protein n=1 Tax=Aegilops tauschii subsp. strangulata TaxID=200361 RepID=A0A453D8F4_AEGTS